jgi:hypothetical protein
MIQALLFFLESRILHTIWTNFFTLWMARNNAIHGHDQSAQQQACNRKLSLQMELLHLFWDQVLASDADAFIGDSQANLDHYLLAATASQVKTGFMFGSH